MLAQTLSGAPYRPPGQPTTAPPPLSLAALPLAQAGEARDIESIALALRTLGSFDFQGTVGATAVRWAPQPP
jgi:hypothetical protein